jgi:HK97 family phage portal protein
MARLDARYSRKVGRPMSLWDTVTLAIATRPKLKHVMTLPEARSIDPFHDFPDLDAKLLAVQGLSPRPWRAAGLREALGVPSILGAVTLISNTVGSLTMRALKNEVEVLPEDRPRVIVRPDPNKRADEFFTDTAYNLATRGEFWWWIAKRDADGNAIALVNIPPEQISVSENSLNILRPTITWNGIGAGRQVKMANRDMIQGTYLRDGASLRGVGPLQLCGAAISVSVESQEWAANFYADGGATSAPIIHSAVELSDDPDSDETEAERFADAWSAKGNNRVRVVDPRIESIDFPTFNPQGAQMLDARMYQNGDTSRMFLIPGELLEYAMSGSSLTYQNLSTVYDDFLRRCLRPNYLSKIESAMSDLIPRAFAARFDTDVLTLADAKTRYDTYAVGITAGIITPEQAQSFEGLQPGDTDNAPVPFSPPQAQITILPTQTRAEDATRCDDRIMVKGMLRTCNKLIPPGFVCERTKRHIA